MSNPRTAREALIAEILGDIDGLLARVDSLPSQIARARGELENTIQALRDAGDKYRMAVTAFTEQAKADLSDHFNSKNALAAQTVSKTVEEQRAALQEAARMAFRSEASDQAASLSVALSKAAKEFRHSFWSRILEHTITALIASTFTAGLVYAVINSIK